MNAVSGSGARSSAIQRTWRLIDRAVHERVGERVELARDVLDRPRRESRQELAAAKRERPQAGVLDLPQTLHLLHDEQRIHADVELLDPAALRLLEPHDEGCVLGHVVRRASEEAHALGYHPPSLVEEDGARSGRTGIAARAAVRVEGRAGHARKPARRSGSMLPPETTATTRSPGFAPTAPLSSAPTAAAPAASPTPRPRPPRHWSPPTIPPPDIAPPSPTP